MLSDLHRLVSSQDAGVVPIDATGKVKSDAVMSHTCPPDNRNLKVPASDKPGSFTDTP